MFIGKDIACIRGGSASRAPRKVEEFRERRWVRHVVQMGAPLDSGIDAGRLHRERCIWRVAHWDITGRLLLLIKRARLVAFLRILPR